MRSTIKPNKISARRPSKRHRRIFFEHLEDRRLLAIATPDTYQVAPGETLTVTGLGAWQNDSCQFAFDGSWYNPNLIWHGPWTEEPVLTEGYWQEPVQYEDENGEIYWSPPSPVCIDCVFVPSEPVEHEGYWEGGWVEEIYYAWSSVLTLPEHGTLTQIDTGMYDYDDNGQPIRSYGLAFTYVPEAGFEGIDSFTYTLNDAAGPSTATVIINVVYPQPEIAITRFTSSDGSQLTIDYWVSGMGLSSFPVALYASYDGISRDRLLETIIAPDHTGDLGNHSLVFTPTFTDPAEDYHLLAVLDHTDAVSERSEANNEAPFQVEALPGPSRQSISATIIRRSSMMAVLKSSQRSRRFLQMAMRC